MLYLFIISFYIDLSLFCCTTRCSCKIMFVSFNSNTRGVTSIERTAYPSGAHEFTSSFQWSQCCSTFSFLCSFFPYHYLSFDLWFLITPFVFPNISFIVLGKGNINIIEGMFRMYVVGYAMQQHATRARGILHEHMRNFIQMYHLFNHILGSITLNLLRSGFR